MNEKEIVEYNKRCAEFLGYTIKPKNEWYIYEQAWLPHGKTHYPISELKFHSDWNWIMEVKEKICQLDIIDEFNTLYDSVAKGYHCVLLPTYKNTFDGFYTKVLNTEKEAVVRAIDQFLVWYEQNK